MYTILDDIGIQKTDITIEQLVVMISSIRKELKKGLSAQNILFFHLIKKITHQQEYDLIRDVGCNGSMLRGVLVDG